MNREFFIQQNQAEYGDLYHHFHWPQSSQAEAAQAERTKLLADAQAAGALAGCSATKIDCRDVSPGCRCCMAGTWSCLFITGLCNTRCFYCPSLQNDPSLPTTNTVQFPLVRDYIEYLEFFGFSGVGISGGEPLLDPQRALEYLTRIKEHFGDRIHTWLYTNGTKATDEVLHDLQQAGLDEIRFDIAALGYNLERVQRAAGMIHTVTIEIPAVPEDFELLKQILPAMKGAGVKYLNLHQLRCTPYNFRNLIERDYTFLHGPKVTVLESELTALKLLNYSLEKDIRMPINYCSFIYKNKFQAISARRRHGMVVKRSWEDLTPAGLIRNMALTGDKGELAKLAAVLRESGQDEGTWQFDTTASRLYISAALRDFIQPGRFPLVVSYYVSSIRPALSYLNAFKEIRLASGKQFVIEREPAFPVFELEKGEAIAAFKELFLVPPVGPGLSVGQEKELAAFLPRIEEIWECEKLPRGLMDYY